MSIPGVEQDWYSDPSTQAFFRVLRASRRQTLTSMRSAVARNEHQEAVRLQGMVEGFESALRLLGEEPSGE